VITSFFSFCHTHRHAVVLTYPHTQTPRGHRRRLNSRWPGASVWPRRMAHRHRHRLESTDHRLLAMLPMRHEAGVFPNDKRTVSRQTPRGGGGLLLSQQLGHLGLPEAPVIVRQDTLDNSCDCSAPRITRCAPVIVRQVASDLGNPLLPPRPGRANPPTTCGTGTAGGDQNDGLAARFAASNSLRSCWRCSTSGLGRTQATRSEESGQALGWAAGFFAISSRSTPTGESAALRHRDISNSAATPNDSNK
jgi:hypothetical protein